MVTLSDVLELWQQPHIPPGSDPTVLQQGLAQLAEAKKNPPRTSPVPKIHAAVDQAAQVATQQKSDDNPHPEPKLQALWWDSDATILYGQGSRDLELFFFREDDSDQEAFFQEAEARAKEKGKSFVAVGLPRVFSMEREERQQEVIQNITAAVAQKAKAKNGKVTFGSPGTDSSLERVVETAINAAPEVAAQVTHDLGLSTKLQLTSLGRILAARAALNSRSNPPATRRRTGTRRQPPVSPPPPTPTPMARPR